MEINYFLDSKRYDKNEYCGTCHINIAVEKITACNKFLGDGQGYHCEECNFIYNCDKDKDNPVFHKNCPCYCYLCPECDLNVLEDDDHEVDCKYGNHEGMRKALAERMEAINY